MKDYLIFATVLCVLWGCSPNNEGAPQAIKGGRPTNEPEIIPNYTLNPNLFSFKVVNSVAELLFRKGAIVAKGQGVLKAQLYAVSPHQLGLSVSQTEVPLPLTEKAPLLELEFTFINEGGAILSQELSRRVPYSESSGAQRYLVLALADLKKVPLNVSKAITPLALVVEPFEANTQVDPLFRIDAAFAWQNAQKILNFPRAGKFVKAMMDSYGNAVVISQGNLGAGARNKIYASIYNFQRETWSTKVVKDTTVAISNIRADMNRNGHVVVAWEESRQVRLASFNPIRLASERWKRFDATLGNLLLALRMGDFGNRYQIIGRMNLSNSGAGSGGDNFIRSRRFTHEGPVENNNFNVIKSLNVDVLDLVITEKGKSLLSVLEANKQKAFEQPGDSQAWKDLGGTDDATGTVFGRLAHRERDGKTLFTNTTTGAQTGFLEIAEVLAFSMVGSNPQKLPLLGKAYLVEDNEGDKTGPTYAGVVKDNFIALWKNSEEKIVFRRQNFGSNSFSTESIVSEQVEIKIYFFEANPKKGICVFNSQPSIEELGGRYVYAVIDDFSSNKVAVEKNLFIALKGEDSENLAAATGEASVPGRAIVGATSGPKGPLGSGVFVRILR